LEGKDMSKRNLKNKKKRKSTFSSGIASLLIIIACSCFFGSFFSSAHDKQTGHTPKAKYYKSIEIEAGDSLWNIAEENMSEEYNSIYEYLDELVSINNIQVASADSIQAGDYLTIVYYK